MFANFSELDPPLALSHYCILYASPRPLSVRTSFSDVPKGGAATVAAPLSLFLQLRHFHCIRHANGADIHFGKREREYRTMGYSPSIFSVTQSGCLSARSKFHHCSVERTAHLQSEKWDHMRERI